MLAAVDLGFVVRAARPEGFIKARDGREYGREAGEFAGGSACENQSQKHKEFVAMGRRTAALTYSSHAAGMLAR